MYSLRIIPSKTVYTDVQELKKQFEYLYGRQPLSGSKPHITLATFKMNSKYQDDLVQGLDRLSERSAFKLTLDGFGTMVKSKTLHLRIPKNATLEELHKETRLLLHQTLDTKVKRFLISDLPHITISKTRSRKMLEDSLKHFRKTKYHREIEVGELTLVSRSKYRSWDWEHQIALS